jgi:Cytochrome c
VLRHDAAALCGHLVPAVAAELVQGAAPAVGCAVAASREFALTAPNEPPAEAGLSLKLVSSGARLATVPGCDLPKPRRCPRGARVLIFYVGVIEPSQRGLLELPIPAAVKQAGGRGQQEFEAGKLVVAQSGCLACHRIGDDGNRGPGTNLTHIGAKLSEREIAHALEA